MTIHLLTTAVSFLRRRSKAPVSKHRNVRVLTLLRYLGFHANLRQTCMTGFKWIYVVDKHISFIAWIWLTRALRPRLRTDKAKSDYTFGRNSVCCCSTYGPRSPRLNVNQPFWIILEGFKSDKTCNGRRSRNIFGCDFLEGPDSTSSLDSLYTYTTYTQWFPHIKHSTKTTSLYPPASVYPSLTWLDILLDARAQYGWHCKSVAGFGHVSYWMW